MIYSTVTGLPSAALPPEVSPTPAMADLEDAAAARHAPKSLLDGSLGDWDALLTALAERLRVSATKIPDGAAAASGTVPSSARQIVLECVADLELLHLGLRGEFARQRSFEPHVDEVNPPGMEGVADLGRKILASHVAADRGLTRSSQSDPR